MMAPDEYVHPYATKSLLWQWSFTIQRALYLLYLSIPLGFHSLRLLFNDGDIPIRDEWCECPPPESHVLRSSAPEWYLVFG